VAYQGTPDDPLVDIKQCNLDATSMAAIGTNSIRVYHVNPYANHDGCMEIFSKHGIYVWLDLDTFNTSIQQTSPTWNADQFVSFTKVMDVFQAYDNLAGFWIGNEIINTIAGSSSAPYIKAAVADMKSYLAVKKYRQIPVGYSAADIAELRPALQNYLACGDDQKQSIDFFGLNSYEWCGQATYETSGYSNLQVMAQGYNIPIFFSETGCNVGGERTFADQAAIFGPNMVHTWSGAIVYEWVQEANNYGLVTYGNGQIYQGQAPVPIQPDYNNLMGQWKGITPPGVAEAAYAPSYSAPACPASTAGRWLVNGNPPLPTLGSAIINAAAQNTPAPMAPALAAQTSVAPTSTASTSAASNPANAVPSQSLSSVATSSHSAPSSLSTAPTATKTNNLGGKLTMGVYERPLFAVLLLYNVFV
jgi:hypothetical protein